jgi:hypothetical protein
VNIFHKKVCYFFDFCGIFSQNTPYLVKSTQNIVQIQAEKHRFSYVKRNKKPAARRIYSAAAGHFTVS